MIPRYSTEEMDRQFSQFSRFDYMRMVEVECAVVQAEMGLIPKRAAKDIEEKAQFQIERIAEIESTTKHDVIAFVSNLAENVGESGRFIHYGLTSSDVLDTALSLQISDAISIVLDQLERLRTTLVKMAKQHRSTICAGRTHGIYAEITTFGFKLAGFASELDRNILRLKSAKEEIMICKLSGAVGTSSALPMEFEQKVAKRLGLRVERFATQVVPRDRHASVMNSLALIAAGFERLAVELRHLQRSEVSEVIEGFSKGQKGSSAMPHKKNPISAENMTGLARLVRGYSLAAQENVALWHERDISHSSVERVAIPDAFQLVHYMSIRMETLLKGLYIDSERMFENTQKLGGVLYSSHLLLHLVQKHKMTREKAYELVQRLSHSLKPGEHLKDKIQHDPESKRLFSKADLNLIFSGKKHLEAIEKRFNSFMKG